LILHIFESVCPSFFFISALISSGLIEKCIFFKITL
jgi:hypothetical protein